MRHRIGVFWKRAVTTVVGVAMVSVGLATVTASPAAAMPSFTASGLAGHSSTAPTSLEFGPDGKLYVANVTGEIDVYEIARNGPNDYVVVSTETITRVGDIVNHDDDGSVTTDVNIFGVRQVTGITVAGTPTNPVIYVSSSDPRIAGQFEDTPLDTNSGVVSRITQTTPGTWVGAAKEDLVRGLPRNEENHSPNGLELSADGNTLYLAVGGHTNEGAPSDSFAFQWEYALSASILAIDLPTIDALPLEPAGCDPTSENCHRYDLPTLDDPTRPNVGGADVNDPWGGNSAAGGANQAIIDPSGPVQVHATGFRNPYDVMLASDGRMYTIDNGPNAGWGGPPNNEGPAGICDNTPNNAGVGADDALHYVRELTPGERYYGGHPNPIRGNPDDIVAATAGTAVPWSGSPVPPSEVDPRECDYLPPFPDGAGGYQDGSLINWGHSTNGMAEYTASNFEGALQGHILAAGWVTGYIVHAEVSFDGADNPSITADGNLLTSSGGALDVDTRGDGETFPGTIWVANFYGAELIEVFEPDETIVCGGPPTADDDSDGFTNQDEIDNGTDPCSAASNPSDADGDFVSDLNDPDDDNDGTPDVTDPFAIDAANGLDRSIPSIFEWEQPVDGILGLEFTGLMNNGTAPWSQQYDPAEMTAIGAAGVLTLDTIGSGDALGTANDQLYAFQLGVDVCDTACAPYRVTTALSQPLQTIATPTTESMGVFMGSGDQSNYVKAVVTPGPGGTGGIQLLVEENDVVTADVFTAAPDVLTSSLVSVNIDVDPIAGTATASYEIDGGVTVAAGGPVSVPSAWSTGPAATAVGIISSSGGAPAFTGTWASLAVENIFGPGGSWTALADMSSARHESSLVALNGQLFALGGRGVQPVEIYNPATDTWTTGATPPVEMHHFQAVVHDDLIYIIGGMTGDFPIEVPLDRVYMYDPYADLWIEGPEIPVDRRRGSSGIAVAGDLIYMVGGIQEGHTAGTVGWTDTFNPITGEWTALPNDMPTPRDHFSVGVIDGNLYAAAGRVTADDLFTSVVSTVDVLDLATGTWSTLADPIPTPRAAPSTAVLGNELIVAGGESGQPDAHVEVEALDATTGTWRSLTPFPAGADRHGTSAAVIDCRWYTAAGSGAQGGNPELVSTYSFQLDDCPIQGPETGTLNAAPSAVDFGTVGVGESSTVTVTITNPGGTDLTITDGNIVGSDAADFSLDSATPITVTAGGSASVDVTYSPGELGPDGPVTTFGDTAAALALAHSGGDSALTVALAGAGGVPGADDPITGLSVTASGPVPVGTATVATATVSGGTNITYDWDMGDGTTFANAGAAVTHTYASEGNYVVTVAASNGVSADTATTTAIVQTAPPASQILINAGGGAYTDTLGRDWSADTAFTGGGTFDTADPIAATSDDVLYQSERFGDVTYSIPVAGPGCYSVTLHFAEIWHGAAGGGAGLPGDRVFDVIVEGAPFLTDYDINAVAGPITAVTETVGAQLLDATVDIQLVTTVDNAKISAIEITPNGASCGPDDPITGLSAANDGPAIVDTAVGFSAAITGGTNVTYDWDFGDGTTVADAGASPSHAYSADGSYTATVTASNNAGSTTATTVVTVDPAPDEPITGLAATTSGPVPIGAEMSLTATITAGTNVVYDWDLGDGTTLTDAGPTITHTYGATGSFTATVTATNGLGAETASTTAVVEDQPVAGLAVSSGGPVEFGVAASLTASVVGGTNVSYDWDLGDGTTLTDAGPTITHTFGAVGFYTVTVTASNPVSSVTASTVQSVTDGPDDPITGLAVTGDGPAELGNDTTFTATITGGDNITYDWDLGDGTTLTDAGPTITHTYGAVGSYTVTVTATNGTSTDTATTATAITDNPITGLNLTNNGPVPDGAPVTLTATITGGTNVSYDWDLGDGTTLTDAGPTITHTYAGVGTYLATVTATNPVDTASTATSVTIEELPAFEIRINTGGGAYTDGAGRAWLADTGFTGGGTFDTGNPIAGTTDDTIYQSERWGGFTYTIAVPGSACYDVTLHFAEIWWGGPGGGGDGDRVFSAFIEGVAELTDYDIHADVGSATATSLSFPALIVDGSVDLSFSASVDQPKISGIEITAAGPTCDPDDPITGLSVSSDSPTEVGSTTVLTAAVTTGTNVTYDWDLGDGTTLTDAGPVLVYTYGDIGSYLVSVAARNDASTVLATTTVDVEPVPDDPITGLAVTGGGTVELGGSASLTATITGGTNVTYDWDLGDGTTLTDAGPTITHTYGTLGTFTPTVTATNTLGSDTASTTVTVEDVAIAGLDVVSGGTAVIGEASSLTASVATGSNVSYDWDLGDGTTLTDAGPTITHTYGAVGSYTVTVTATNGTSTETATTTAVVAAAPDDPITGLAVTGDGPAELGNDTTFTATITGGDNVTYDWNLGDGTTLTDAGPTITHTYSAVGSYTVTVTATNGTSTDTATTATAITDNPITGLNLTNNGPVIVGVPVTAAATITGGSNVTYDFTWGDGAVAADAGNAPSYLYAAAGSYTVTVTASNGAGSVSATTTVSVTDAPVSGLFVTGPTAGFVGDPASFSAGITDGTDVTYDWDFGDGNLLPMGGSAVTHSYATSGTYIVEVTASNSVSTETTTLSITIADTPAFSYRVNVGGGAYIDGSGESWLADTGFTGGSTFDTGSPIAGTTDDPLYQSERYGDFSYSIAVPATGCYSVTTHFAELWWGGPGGGGDGDRVFDIAIEGNPVLTGYDIHADVGPETAATQTFLVQIADGTLDLSWTTVADNAKVSAIELIYTGGGCPPA